MRLRIAMIAAAIAVLGVVLPGVAHAEPPPNDDFAASSVVPALPFAVRLDTGEATRAADDPFWCQGFNIGGTVWFSFTPAEDGLLRATTAGSDHGTILSVHTGVRGELRGVPGACDSSTISAATVTFPASAGTTYHVMVAGYDVPGGALSFGLDVVPPAPNDNFGGAEPLTTLPVTREPDLSTASSEFDEPFSRCVDGTAARTVWYAFTPADTISVVARIEQSSFDNDVAVYTGSTLPDLREVACAGRFESAVFRAHAGVTYYLRVSGPVDFARPISWSLTEAPALQPYFSTSPSDPTIYEQTHFVAGTWDPLSQPIVGGEWDFGDGTTAPVTATTTPHHYTRDGTYQVRLTIVTQDGRTGTVTGTVTVNTHDVAISRFSVPARARVGETKPIRVHVTNTRYPESVTTELYKSDGSSWELVGTLTLDVPARPDRAVEFPFAYTFTPADAVVGKVTFRAVVVLPYPLRDARPMDNEVIAIATNVRPSAADLRFS